MHSKAFGKVISTDSRAQMQESAGTVVDVDQSLGCKIMILNCIYVRTFLYLYVLLKALPHEIYSSR